MNLFHVIGQYKTLNATVSINGTVNCVRPNLDAHEERPSVYTHASINALLVEHFDQCTTRTT